MRLTIVDIYILTDFLTIFMNYWLRLELRDDEK